MEKDRDPLTKEALPEYVRQWNQDHKTTKINLWRRTAGQGDGQLTVLRFTIPDVLIVYVSLAGAALIAETVTAFAPREKVCLARKNGCTKLIRLGQKSPHSQSDYVVYQSLSQQIAKMVQSHPLVSVQSILVSVCGVKRASGTEFAF